MFKDDIYGNKVPYMAVNSKNTADRLLKSGKDFITIVIEIPKSVRSIIKM